MAELARVGQHFRRPGRVVAVPEILSLVLDVLVVVGANAFIHAEEGARRRVAPAPEGEQAFGEEGGMVCLKVLAMWIGHDFARGRREVAWVIPRQLEKEAREM